MAARSNRNKSNSNNLSSWIFPILLLCFVPPAGVLWIVLKIISDAGKRSGGRQQHPFSQYNSSEPVGARTTTVISEEDEDAAKQQASRFTRTQNQKLAEMEGKAKRMAVIGGVALVIFTMLALPRLLYAFEWLLDGYLKWFLNDLLNMMPRLCLMAGAGGVMGAGLRKRKQIRRFRRYLAMIGRHRSVSLNALAETTGRPLNKVCDDLEDMLNDGFFPKGFLDYGNKQLVVSSTGVSDAPKPKKKKAPKAEPEPKKDEDENAILAEIRQINDDIDNEKLSQQIDRIGVITAKILEYQKSSPEKAPQLHSFLSYYLPTTLKILRAYAKLEDQEVSGQNITTTMERIESMMDKVVEGFETQLDLLFQGDAMDITTDVEVLERMLAKDGLSNSDGISMKL